MGVGWVGGGVGGGWWNGRGVVGWVGGRDGSVGVRWAAFCSSDPNCNPKYPCMT